MTRTLTIFALVAAIALTGVASAFADGIGVGGSVYDEIALSIGRPTSFVRVAGTHSYELKIPVKLTSTAAVTTLSVADGGASSGSAHGGPMPLQVALVGRAQQSLAALSGATLFTWGQPLAQSASVIKLLTEGSVKPSALHKVLLVTVSSQEP